MSDKINSDTVSLQLANFGRYYYLIDEISEGWRANKFVSSQLGLLIHLNQNLFMKWHENLKRINNLNFHQDFRVDFNTILSTLSGHNVNNNHNHYLFTIIYSHI